MNATQAQNKLRFLIIDHVERAQSFLSNKLHTLQHRIRQDNQISLVTVVFILFVFSATGCSNIDELNISHATTASLPLDSIKSIFEKDVPGARLNLYALGSTAALSFLRDGKSDMAVIAREPSTEEQREFIFMQLARDNLAIITHRDSDLSSNVSMSWLKAIYTSNTPDGTIMRVIKNPAHGTAQAFAESIGTVLASIHGEIEAGGNSEVLHVVSSSRNSIGYVSAPDATRAIATDQPIKVLTVDGIDVGNRAYPLSRNLYLAIRHDALIWDRGITTTGNIIRILQSTAGREAFERLGFISFMVTNHE